MKTRFVTSWLLIAALMTSPIASFAMPFFCGSQAKACCCGSDKSCDKPTSSDLTLRRADTCCPVLAALDTRMQVVRVEEKEVAPTFHLAADAVDVIYVFNFSVLKQPIPYERVDRPSGRDRTIFLQTFLI